MSSAASTTWVARLTPPGAAAIAVLGLHGPEAWSLARTLFRPISQSGRLLPEQPEPGRSWVGRLGGELADEVVLVVRSAALVPWLELHGHGGREVLHWLVEMLQAHGVRSCSWQDFEQLTTGDALQTAAVAALVQAATPRTAAILLDQYHGALARTLTSIRAALDRHDEAGAGCLLEELAQRADVGRHLVSGWRVVIAGAPNVGKSSLVNALAGFQRSVVSTVPGTTRDVVKTRIAVEGWPIELADTAGLRPEAEALEEQGMARARQAAAAADLCLWLLDASSGPVWPGAANVRLVVNKIDLPPLWDLRQASGAIRVSAQTGEGLEELCQALARWLVPIVPPPGAAVPFAPEICQRIDDARLHLQAGRWAEARDALAGALQAGPQDG
jgi:tRNA modification GTPase